MTSADVLAWLNRRRSRRNIDGMARYAIRSERVFGVSMATMKPLTKRLRFNHDLALELWKSGWHEARIIAVLVDDPGRLTLAQMNAWAADFDNWAICDTACMHLFDKSDLAWTRIRVWSRSKHEFTKRAAFALIASLAVHDRSTPDRRFLALLPLVERAAVDERNFVRKGVNWALRAIGNRSPALHRAALQSARRLARAKSPASRWVGMDALRDLSRPIVHARLERRRGASDIGKRYDPSGAR